MLEIIKSRCSCRKFLEKDIPSSYIEDILEGAMCAPSAGNQRPWEFYVVTDIPTINELSKSHKYATCVKDARTVIVVCYKKDTRYPEYNQIDCAIASQNILLGLEEYGLGGVFIGIAPIEERMESVKNILSLEDNKEAFCLIPCGYAYKKSERFVKKEQDKIHTI